MKGKKAGGGAAYNPPLAHISGAKGLYSEMQPTYVYKIETTVLMKMHEGFYDRMNCR